MPDNEVTANVAFTGIEVLHHRLDPLLPTEAKPAFGFSISLTYRFQQEQEQAQVELDIQFLAAQTNKSIGELRTCCTFATLGTIQFDKATEEVTLDDAVLDMFISLSISTTRGILHTYFANSYLHPVILPIIDPRAFRPPGNPTPA